jgi:hypothetical protein
MVRLREKRHPPGHPVGEVAGEGPVAEKSLGRRMYPATAFKNLERALQEGLGRREFGSTDMRQVKEFFGNSCAYCGSSEWDRWDHLVPAIRGGESVLGNMVTACQPCDHSKGSRAFDLWMAARAIAKPEASWAIETPARVERLREYQRQFGYVATKAESRLSPEQLAQFEALIQRAKELQRDVEAFIRPLKDEGIGGEATREDRDGPRSVSLSEDTILEIAADHVEKDGYVVYDDFSELKPVTQTGNRYLFGVKNTLLVHGYRLHERRHRAEWDNCGYPGDNTHFHGN